VVFSFVLSVAGRHSRGGPNAVRDLPRRSLENYYDADLYRLEETATLAFRSPQRFRLRTLWHRSLCVHHPATEHIARRFYGACMNF
jgi:hypothetical protein